MRRQLTKFIIISFFICLAIPSMASIFPAGTKYQVCFTPGQKCTQELARAIDHARHSVYVQAYAFTSHKIGNALARAQKRGVHVYIILDKSNFLPKAHTSAYFLMRRKVPIWNDYKPTIAHNKVMIIDRKIVETGSFNYTWSAEHKNAENMIFITNHNLVKLYLNNWLKREKVSKPMDNAAKRITVFN